MNKQNKQKATTHKQEKMELRTLQLIQQIIFSLLEQEGIDINAKDVYLF